MSKYIIEIEEGKEGVMFCQSGIASIGLHLKDEKSLRGLGIRSAIPYTEPDTEKVREEAFKNGYDAACKDIDIKSKTTAAYQKGLEDAWAAARKIVCRISDGGYTQDLLDRIFGNRNYQSIMAQYSASDAVEKISKYEKYEPEQEEKEIQVGDEVEFNDGDTAIWMCDNPNEDEAYLMFSDGSCGSHENSAIVRKTGRHFPEIAAVLTKMKEGSDG